MKITLYGRIPSKKNSRITVRKTGMSFPSKKYTQWQKEQSLFLKIPPYEKGQICQVRIDFWMPCNRKADLTNKAESLLDLLVDNKVIGDDSWQHIPQVLLNCYGVDKENPRAEITFKCHPLIQN